MSGRGPAPGGRNPDERTLYGTVDGDAACNEAIAELYSFLDGELTTEKRVAIAAHLDDCHPCLEAFDFEAELRIVVAHHCREQVPEHLKERISDLLAADGGRSADQAD